jgi:cobalt-zinc-cadmium efflux system outer membrane protein
VTGGKLSRARQVFRKETQLAEIEAEEQKIRVETAVKIAFYRVLAAQELADAAADLARVAQESLETELRLQNSGQADETDVIRAELEARRMKLAARTMENTLREEWRALASVLGPAGTAPASGWRRPRTRLAGIGRTTSGTGGDAKSGHAHRDERRGTGQRAARPCRTRKGARRSGAGWPGLQSRAARTIRRSRPAGSGTPQVAVELPIFNRNQGNIAAARSDIERAEAEKQRVALTLRERASTAFDEYVNARLTAEEYRDAILPLAQKSYSLMFDRYGEMLASFPRVIESKRKLFELQSEYIASLETVWTTGLSLQGFLLTDGLEAPTQPGEMDRTIRETNLPTPDRRRLP